MMLELVFTPARATVPSRSERGDMSRAEAGQRISDDGVRSPAPR
jgi:hypothetical protein